MKRMTKDDILKALETISAPGEGQNLVESKAITNIQIFGDEVEVDVTINNPSFRPRRSLKYLFYKPFTKRSMKRPR
jgi:ATP-binding protein involved in chromosome partitioning